VLRICPNLWSFSMPKCPKVSVIIPSLGRSEALTECLQSINGQTFTDFEVILETEEGPLAKIRNQGAKKARGEYLVFCDDDIIATENWLKSIVEAFQSRDVFGVSGPSIITNAYRKNRDIFRWPFAKFLYDSLFLGRSASLPGHITEAGTWTTGACDATCKYEGQVHFLEACNMSYRADVFRQVGGFDETFGGVGDWSEPDLSFRLRRLGGCLVFVQGAKVYHRPSRSGAFGKRKRDASNRLRNYYLFAKRWVRPHWKHTLYRLFLEAYYGYQTIK